MEGLPVERLSGSRNELALSIAGSLNKGYPILMKNGNEWFMITGIVKEGIRYTYAVLKYDGEPNAEEVNRDVKSVKVLPNGEVEVEMRMSDDDIKTSGIIGEGTIIAGSLPDNTVYYSFDRQAIVSKAMLGLVTLAVASSVHTGVAGSNSGQTAGKDHAMIIRPGRLLKAMGEYADMLIRSALLRQIKLK